MRFISHTRSREQTEQLLTVEEKELKIDNALFAFSLYNGPFLFIVVVL